MPKKPRAEKFRFDLPSVIDPDDDWCIVVKIPGHADYLAALAGHISLLTRSENFARDDSLTGAARTARRWKKALYSQPLTRFNCEDINMALDFRVKPGFPYTTQVSTDGGVSWHDMLIQPHWESNTVAPPIASINDANDYTKTMLKLFWLYLVQQIDDGITGGQTKAQTVSQIAGTFVPYGAGAALSDAVSHLYDEFAAMPSAEQADWLDDCQYEQIYDDVRNFANENPYSWLDNMATWIYEHLNDWSDTLMYWLNSAAAALGGNQVWNFVANEGGAGGGAGFGDSCGFSHVFDFTINDGGWTPASDLVYTVAQYVPGVGWANNDDTTDGPGNKYRYVSIQKVGIATFTATRFKAYCTMDRCSPFIASFPDSLRNQAGSLTTGSDTSTGEITLEWTGSATIEQATAQFNACFKGPSGTLSGSAVITKIEIDGDGFDPY